MLNFNFLSTNYLFSNYIITIFIHLFNDSKDNDINFYFIYKILFNKKNKKKRKN